MSAIVVFTRLGWGIRVGRGVCSAEWLGLRVISSVNSDRVRDMGKTRPPFLSQRENVTVWQKKRLNTQVVPFCQVAGFFKPS